MLGFRNRNQSGDTIVEVLIVLSILSLAFVISYSTATRGLSQSRSAQEHSEALGLLNEQLELIRTAATNPDTTVFANSVPFCLGSDAKTKLTPATDLSIGGNCTASDGLYHYQLVYNAGTVTGTVRWNGVGSSGVQQEDVNYKIASVAGVPVQYSQTATVATPPPVVIPPTEPEPDPDEARTWRKVATLQGSDINQVFLGCLTYETSATASPYTIGAGGFFYTFGGEGCHTTGTSMYARQSAGFSYPYTAVQRGGIYRFAVKYKQYPGDNKLPPANYGAFAITNSVAGFTYNDQSGDLGFVDYSSATSSEKYAIESTSVAHSSHTKYTKSFTSISDYISPGFNWTNGNPSDRDAALQIDSIEIQKAD